MRGPEFLGFYIVYGLCVLGVIALFRAIWGWMYRAPTESLRWRPGVYPSEGDAYTIALLRGGPREVALAIFGRLVTEGFLVLEGGILRQPSQPATARARLSPLEEEAIAVVAEGVPAKEALGQMVGGLEPRLARLREELEAEGLAPGISQRPIYGSFGLAALLLVPGLGLAKLVVALARGKSNILFLVILMILGALAAVALSKLPGQTTAGKRFLKWLKESHQGLVQMVSAGRSQRHGDIALVAAIFGIEILPALAPLKLALVPPPKTGDSSGGCGGSSSCSSGCGGGGGCGGGCGGCGG
jgi:uncharacterized protein (TIGR04222 family)